MKKLLNRYNYFILLLLVFGVAECIVNPIGDFPLNDDWSYGKAVYYSLKDSYTIGGFGAMTLFTHLVWGMAFVKFFGFSFTVLRVSTLLSVIISLFFLDRLVFRITQKKLISALACLILLFNPLYFNLANTYMTDVNFNTLLILCCYCAFVFFEKRSPVFFALFFLFSGLMVLMRQFGIIVPFCFTMGCLILKEKKWLWVVFSVGGSFLVFLLLKSYEKYLSGILPPDAAYKFSGGINFSDKIFRDLFFYSVSQRYHVVLSQILVYSAPLALIFMGFLLKQFKTYISLALLALTFGFVYWLFSDTEFPFHNVFINAALGPETFYESLSSTHSHSEIFDPIARIVLLCFATITFGTFVLYVAGAIKNKLLFSGIKPFPVFLSVFLIGYGSLLFVTESYFDRYHIPLITAMLVLVVHFNNRFEGNCKPILVPAVLFFYISVFGTKDYLTWNRLRWEAFDYLKKQEHVSAEQVNGGFEINCWNDSKNNWWYNYTTLENFDYLIQFKPEKGFRLYKSFEFQRYFPYKKDKINIFVKEAKE